MLKFTIEVKVDEAKLKEAVDLDELQDIEEVIKSEMSWVKGSGIYVTKVNETSKQKKRQIPQTPSRCNYCGRNPKDNY